MADATLTVDIACTDLAERDDVLAYLAVQAGLTVTHQDLAVQAVLTVTGWDPPSPTPTEPDLPEE